MLFHTECDLFGGGSKYKIWVNEEKWEIAVGPTMVQIWGGRDSSDCILII